MMPEHGARPRGLRSSNLSSRSQAWPGAPSVLDSLRILLAFVVRNVGRSTQLHPKAKVWSMSLSLSSPSVSSWGGSSSLFRWWPWT